MKKLNSILLLLAMLLTVQQPTMAVSFKPEAVVVQQEVKGGLDLTNPKINKLIDKDLKRIKKKGYGKLVIPAKLNKIDQSVISDDALWVCKQLTDAGFKAYIVGGAIRDLIMHKDADDFDVVTDAVYEDMLRIFGDKLHIHMSSGRQFEGVRVSPDRPSIDLATYGDCPELYLQKGVVAKKYVEKSLLGDSFQRDFAFNALYYEPATGNLYDFHGGIADIRDHRISTMTNPDYELEVSPWIIPRALRFQAKYQYAFTPEFEETLLNRGLEYFKHSGNDILNGNISKMFWSTYGIRCYNNMIKYNIFDRCFPVLSELEDRAAYDKWIVEEIKKHDQNVANGLKPDYSLPISLITFPVYKQLRRTMEPEEAVKHIHDAQRPVMNIWPSEIPKYIKHYEERLAEEQ